MFFHYRKEKQWLYLCKHKLPLIFSGTMPSYTNKHSRLPIEWQTAENKERLPEKGWLQSCLVSLFFSLGIHYQPLYELVFLCSGIGNRIWSCCDPSGRVAASWSQSHWFAGRSCCLLEEKEMKAEVIFEWENLPTCLYKQSGERKEKALVVYSKGKGNMMGIPLCPINLKSFSVEGRK